ncbi:MAG: pilus (MSHA type) biogenesis protein MshL [Pseudomonadota bacterium]
MKPNPLTAHLMHFSLALVTALTLGCATNPPPTETPAASVDVFEDALRVATEAPPAPPPEVAAALLPTPRPAQATAKPAPERFDVDVVDAPAASFFAGLVEGTRTNLVVHPDVSGTVSLKMNGVTLGEVLETVRAVYGYEIRPSGKGYIVMPASLQTRIFQVDYLDLSREGVSRMRVSSGQVSERRDNQGMNGNQGGFGVGNVGANPQVADPRAQGQAVTGSRIDTTYTADFWTDLEEALLMIVNNGEGRRVVINTQTGVIMVRGMPEELRSIETYLESVQVAAQRQVLLEAKVVEVELNDAFQAGINWVAVAQNSSGHTYTFGQSAPPGAGAFRTDIDSIGGSPISVGPGVTYGGFDSTNLGSAFTMAFDIGDFNAFIELLEIQGDTRVLSSPRVATLNNQKAVIKAGTDEFFVTDVSSNTVTGTAATTTRDVELTPFFSGIALDVTPQISADNVVTLHVHPTVSEVFDQEKDLTVSGETDRLPLAFSEIRESDTVVRARSGQIIVIGGLMRESRSNEDFGTPGLSALPLVGNLFKSQRRVTRKSELVILLKPVVVEDERTWSVAAQQSLDRIRSLQ